MPKTRTPSPAKPNPPPVTRTKSAAPTRSTPPKAPRSAPPLGPLAAKDATPHPTRSLRPPHPSPGRSAAPGPVSTSRKPNYGSGGRLLRILLALLQSPRGFALDDLAWQFRISRKTTDRYASVLVHEVDAPDGSPLFELVKPDGRPTLRLRDASGGTDATEYQAASLFLSAAALRSLGQNLLQQSADDAWDKFASRLPKRTREALAHIERKFCYVPFAAKSYRDHEDQLDLVLRAVLRNRELLVDYRKPAGRRSTHRFQPFTLVLYRDALYVLGRSDRHPKPIYLAIDRIESARPSGAGFAVPSDFHPTRHLEGVFGIWDGKPVTVTLRLRGDAATQIPERVLSRTQTFTPTRGGDTLMRFEVRGWQELAWWILSWAGDVEVLEPRDLRDNVRGRLRDAAALYER